MAPLHLELGRIVRRRRAAAGYSQESFAARIGLHRTYVGKIERGEQNVSLSNLQTIARGLGVRLSQLLREAEEGTDDDAG
jgi:transcriptional regulator with XRE-family HTH domain